MYLALPLIVGLLIGKLSGGRFKNLAAAPLRAGWLFILGLAIQLALYTPLTDTQQWAIRCGPIFYVASLLLLFTGLSINIGRLQWPLVVMTAGAGLNLIVIALNGGAMPVDAHLLASVRGHGLVSGLWHHRFASNVAPITGSTRLGLLGDNFAIWSSVYSIGDVVLGIGGLLTVIAEMHQSRAASQSQTALKGSPGAAQAA